MSSPFTPSTESRSAFEPLERMPDTELQLRWTSVRGQLARSSPEASGLMVFSRLNIYYLSGTLAHGVLWLPREGRPVLLVRKGFERARLESPLADIMEYHSYKELQGLLAEAGSPMGNVAAAEMSGLPWSMANMLLERVPQTRFVPGEAALMKARTVKTPWEMAKMREAGRRHSMGLQEVLPLLIHHGMTEQEIARLCIDTFLELGHGGIERMTAPGEEVFFGHLAARDSGNYPHYYNGPMGFRGAHPALPCLGSDTVWLPGTPLTVDMAFTFEGYITDKTQTYWPGGASSLPDVARQAYEVCVTVQNRAAEALRPGAVPAHIWRETIDYVSGTPFRAGFMGLGGNQVPFLGHGIGLAIDEQPVIAKGFIEPLEQGMVIALEPKIGIPGFGMVGVENTFEISPEGGKCLTGDKMGIIFLED